ncbi:hypothetical protein [Bacillus sp. Brlt_9]|uniref:hypothetical protein n=1 Tax=Bacillus sp. Brlt_9 TaxID=3110916 RepID=UPI003F7B44DE
MNISEIVNSIFQDCLFNEFEIVNGIPNETPIKVQGLNHTFCFHPERLDKNKKAIDEIISVLPDTFKEGWSFYKLCYTKDGMQWTDLHQRCEQIMVLGIAIQKMEYCLPRESWSIFPGALPYLTIKA